MIIAGEPGGYCRLPALHSYGLTLSLTHSNSLGSDEIRVIGKQYKGTHPALTRRGKMALDLKKLRKELSEVHPDNLN